MNSPQLSPIPFYSNDTNPYYMNDSFILLNENTHALPLTTMNDTYVLTINPH